jgi:hypothetical protein
MTNPAHLIAVPEREDSLVILLRCVHGVTRNTTTRTPVARVISGQSRFVAFVLRPDHLGTALAYVDRNTW